MTAGTPIDGAPRRILLASDLSARCDRALDRSVQLALGWGAELVALTAVEHIEAMPDLTLDWLAHHRPHGQADFARRLLSRELRRHPDLRFTVSVVPGDPVEAIRATAAALECPLVATGVARDEPFGRIFTGSTAEALARSGPPLLLVVRERPHEAYRRMLVATDFSAASQQALATALALFPGARVTLYHAHEPAFSGLASPAAQHAGARERRREAQDFLLRCRLPAEDLARIEVVVEAGAVELEASRYVRDHDIELAVIGNRGAGGLADLLLGSSAARLLQWLPCDVLLVRAGGQGK